MWGGGLLTLDKEHKETLASCRCLIVFKTHTLLPEMSVGP